MTAAPAPVVVFGDVCLHVTVRPSGLGDFCTGDVDLSPGGSAAMVALQVAALGRPVVMMGVAGQDRLADRLVSCLVAAGIDCSRWTSVPGATAKVAILVGADGSHSVVVEQGGVEQPGEALAAGARDACLPRDALCYVPGFPAYDAVRVILAERRARVVCDFGFRPWLASPATARENILPRVGGVAVAVCSGASFSDEDNRALAQACVAGGATAVVTSLGARGCLLSDGYGTTPLSGFSTHAVNTLGAGDSLVAGLLTALADRYSLREACIFGQAVAAAKITTLARPAARNDVCTLLGTTGWSS